jgi:hypothetical protein
VLFGVVTMAIGGCLYLWSVDPHNPTAIMPGCPTKFLTHLDCPGCGGLRATHALLHGDLRLALRDNAFLVVLSPVILWLLTRAAQGYVTDQPTRVSSRLAGSILAVAVAWAVVRNLPNFPWKPVSA